MKPTLVEWLGKSLERTESLYRQYRESINDRLGDTQSGIVLPKKQSKLRRWLELVGACILLLACFLAGLGADDLSRGIVWSWLPQFLLLLVVGFGILARGAFYNPFNLIIGVMIGTGLLWTRIWTALRTQVPNPGLSEAYLLFTGLLLLFAFWLIAGRRPVKCYLAWLAALVLLLASRFLLSIKLAGIGKDILSASSPSIFLRPDLMPLMLSILWAGIAFGGIVLIKRQRHIIIRSEYDEELDFLQYIGPHLLALVLGVGLGYMCLQLTITPNNPTYYEQLASEDMAEIFWAKSVLLGWGRPLLWEQVRLMNAPLPMRMPLWSGWYGTLAAWGVVSMVFAICGSILFMSIAFRRGNFRGLTMGTPPQLALLGAQTMLGLIIVGGPQSEVPFILLCGWAGLGLAPRPPYFQGVRLTPEQTIGQRVFRRLISAPVLVGLIIAVFITVGPAYGKWQLDQIQLSDFTKQNNAQLASRLNKLKGIWSPWDANVYLMDGQRLRQSLQDKVQSGEWDEHVYDRAVENYQQAARLNPFEPLIVMNLAQLQETADRQADAISSIRRGLEINPTAQELMDWLYVQSMARGDFDVAREMVDRALENHPQSARWWRKRYEVESARGRIPSARIAVHVALTKDPSNEELGKQAFARKFPGVYP